MVLAGARDNARYDAVASPLRARWRGRDLRERRRPKHLQTKGRARALEEFDARILAAVRSEGGERHAERGRDAQGL